VTAFFSGTLVEAALASLEPQALARSHPLETWERWLALLAVLERVEHQARRAVLATLWHAGVRNTADRADYLGDVPTALMNRENARVALRASS
jgi:hypothetical protein